MRACVYAAIAIVAVCAPRGPSTVLDTQQSQLEFPSHPQLALFMEEIVKCSSSVQYCNFAARNVSALAVKIAYELASIHLDGTTIGIFETGTATHAFAVIAHIYLQR